CVRGVSLCFRHNQNYVLKIVAGTTGLEPATSAVTGQRSNQLSYVPKTVYYVLVIRHIESSVWNLSPFFYLVVSSPGSREQRDDMIEFIRRRPFNVHILLPSDM